MATNGADNAILCLVCDGEGVVRFESVVAPRPAAMLAAPAAAEPRAGEPDDAPAGDDDGWSSGAADESLPAGVVVGAPLVKTYWFDHNDCDAREIGQILRRCARDGTAGRARVWLRLDAEQLTRVELTFTPLAADAERSGRLVLVRAEPTPATPLAGRRGARAGAAETKPIDRGEAPAGPGGDLLDVRLPTPMLRLDRARGTILAANAALADLVGRPDRASCVNLPLTELVDPRDRRAIAEFLAAARAASSADRTAEVRLLAPDGRDATARLSIVPDPDGAAADGRVLIVVRDVSSEAQVAQLMARADQLADVAVRNSSMLRTLERAFERAPVGFALLARGERLRANPAFESAAARAPDVAAAAADSAARARRDRVDVAHEAGGAHVRSYWAGDEQHDVVGTLVWPRDAAAPSDAADRLRALARATDDDARVALAWIARGDDAAAIRFIPVDGEPAPDAVLDAASLAAIGGAVAIARNVDAPRAVPVTLADGRAAEATVAPLPAGDEGPVAAVAVALVRATPEQVDRLRDELATLREQSLAHAEASRALRAELDAVDRQAAPLATRLADERAAHLDALRTAADAGTFAWDVIDGHIEADARARALLSCGDGPLDQAALLAAADADDRRAYERALFDGLNADGGDEIDVVLRVGPDARPVRIVGRVLFDDATDPAERDPTRFVAGVVDLAEAAERKRRIETLDGERDALAARIATLEAEGQRLGADLATRIAAVEAAEARAAALAADRDALTGRVDALAAEGARLTEAVAGHAAAAEAAESNAATLAADRDALRDALTARDADLAARAQQLAALARDAEAFAADRAALVASAGEIEREREAARAELTTAREKLSKLESEHAAAGARATSLDRDRATLDERLKRAEAERAKVADALAQADAKLKAIEGERAAAEKRISKLEKERAAGDEATKRAETARAELATRLAKAESDATAAAARADAAAKDLASRDAELKSLAAKSADVGRDRDEARAALAAAAAELETIRKKAKEAAAAQQSLGTTADKLKAKLDAAERDRDAATTKRDAVTRELADLRAAHEKAETERAELDVAIATLRDELAAAVRDRAAAEQQAKTLERDRAALEANVRTLNRDRATLEADAARQGRLAEAATAELNRLRTSADQVDAERDALAGRVEALTRDVEERDAAAAAMRAALDAATIDRDAARASLKHRSAELNALFELAGDAIRIRADGVTRHNAAAAAMYGDAIALGFDDATNPRLRVVAVDDVPANGKATPLPAAAALAGENRAATIALRDEGEDVTRIVQSAAAPVVVDGKVVGAVVVDAEQTDVRRVEAQLARREQELAAIFQNTGVGVAYLNAAGEVLDANPQTSVLLGFGHQDLAGRPLVEIGATPTDRTTLDGLLTAVLGGELASCSAEFQLTRRDGRPYWVQLTVGRNAVDDAAPAANAAALVVLIQDVDELHRLRAAGRDAEATIAAARSRARLISTAAGEGLALVDAAGNVVEANDASRRLLAIDDPTARFTHADTGEPITAAALWARLARGAVPSDYRVERDGAPAGGRIVRVGSSRSVGIEGVADADAQMVVVRATDVSDAATMQEELRRAQGRIVEAHTLMRDRTTQLEGNFVSAMQQLGAATAIATMPARSLASDARLAPDIRDAAKRVADAIRVHERLVAHFNAAATTAAKPKPAEASASVAKAPVDVHALVEEAVELVDERFRAGNRLRRHLDAARSTCDADAALARHGLWSIFAHAVSQAPPRTRGAAVVRTSIDAAGDRLTLLLTWPTARRNTAEIYIARSLIEASGGTMDVGGDDAETRVEISFTLVDERLIAQAAPPPPPAARAVLLIEDHESTARVLSRQLARLGCEVRHVRGLAEARAAIDATPTLELVVCDLTMPGGDAVAFLRDLAKRDVPAIALGGYDAASGDADALRAAGVAEQLVKPVDLNALAAAIRRLTRDR